jgi:hypothetical protein
LRGRQDGVAAPGAREAMEAPGSHTNSAGGGSGAPGWSELETLLRTLVLSLPSPHRSRPPPPLKGKPARHCTAPRRAPARAPALYQAQRSGACVDALIAVGAGQELQPAGLAGEHPGRSQGQRMPAGRAASHATAARSKLLCRGPELPDSLQMAPGAFHGSHLPCDPLQLGFRNVGDSMPSL